MNWFSNYDPNFSSLSTATHTQHAKPSGWDRGKRKQGTNHSLTSWGGGVTVPIMHPTDSNLHHLVSFNLQGGQNATCMRVKLESGGNL